MSNDLYGFTTNQTNKLSEDIKSYSGIVLSPNKNSKQCKINDKTKSCKPNSFKIKLANGSYEITVQIGNIDPMLSRDDKVSAFLNVNGVEFFYDKLVPYGTFIFEKHIVEVDDYILTVSNPCKSNSRAECQ